uniref:Large ribosomal subunit protein uL24 n=1 Tax=candidate division WWE3 bacterium TaxID=2053526 RepID=A0A7C4XTA0_UNCKA
MKIRKEDKVKVIKGKDAGKSGKVLSVLRGSNKVLIEGVNVVKRHVKPGVVSKEGGVLSIERPISLANVMMICPKCTAPMRVGYKIDGDEKYRICKRCGEKVDK